jgi:hypothetical protein
VSYQTALARQARVHSLFPWRIVHALRWSYDDAIAQLRREGRYYEAELAEQCLSAVETSYRAYYGQNCTRRCEAEYMWLSIRDGLHLGSVTRWLTTTHGP